MRFLVFIGILAGLALPAHAVEKATVAQVEQILAEQAAKIHTSEQQPQYPDQVVQIADSDLLPGVDDSVLSRLADIELTERMSTLSLYRIVGQYKLGAHVQMILQQMADRSALLKLPSDEEIPQSSPDPESQSAMFNAARDYVFGKLSHLPDFVATRTTTTFDDTPTPLKYLSRQVSTAQDSVAGILCKNRSLSVTERNFWSQFPEPPPAIALLEANLRAGENLARRPLSY